MKVKVQWVSELGVIAAMVMIWWSGRFTSKLEELNIVNGFLHIYVDDVNGSYEPIEPGIDYINGKLEYVEEKAKEDAEISDDKRTMDVVQIVANSINKMIEMTTDFPSNNIDMKVPMLYMRVWIDKESQDIFHEFYEKPTHNRYVISKDSAMPMVKKTDSLSQGIFCCLHNTKHEICWDKKVEMLEKYMCELKASQYSVRDRNEILRSGINWYEKLQKMDSEGIRPFLGARIMIEQKEKESR